MEPIARTPLVQPIEGDSHVHLIAPLQLLGRELGFAVERRELPSDGPRSWCDRRARRIVGFR